MLHTKTRAVRHRLWSPGPPRGALLLGSAVLLAVLLFVSLRRGSSELVVPEISTNHPRAGNGRGTGHETQPSRGSGRRGGAHSPTTKVRGKDTDFPLVEEFSLGPGIKAYDNEDARRVGFPVRDHGRNATIPSASGPVVIFLATKYFGEWNPRHYYFLHFGNTTFARYACPVDNCLVTRDPSRIAEAVLFHVRDTEVFSVPPYRSPEQLWILYSMEPPWLEVRDMRRFDGLFNWTMSYRRDSDVTVRYGFVGRRKEAPPPPPKRLEAVPDHKTNRAVWLVSNCHTDSNREGYVARLRRVYPVDVVGGCGRKACGPAETRKCYLKLTRRYKFYLAFENALCRDYVTEKLFNVLEYFVVPVVLGGADYSELTPRRSVIDASSFPTPEALGRYLWEVSANDSLYLSYFEWKEGYRSYLQPWMCDLCERLHHHRGAGRVAAKTGRELEGWWHGRRCRRWTEDGFRDVERHPFPKYGSRLFPEANSTSN